jgi:hypothetical protein
MSPFAHDIEFLRNLAARRRRLHTGQKSQNILADDGDFIGLLGESAFALWSALPMDLSDRKDGDNGVDFITSHGVTIDVKTAKKTGLLVQADKLVLNRIYVLARPSGALLGWATGHDLAKIPARVTNPREVRDMPVNHKLDIWQLGWMSKLRPLL